jgi:uncharacterized membrane protein YfcA
VSTEIVSLVLLGVVVGTYGSIVGVGGGFLIVPVLLLAWHVGPAAAAGTSLVVVFLNATTGSLAQWRHGRIDVRAGLAFAAATIPGAIAGAFLAERLSGPAFTTTFGVLLLLVAALLLWKPERGEAREKGPATGGWQRTLRDRSGTEFRWGFSLPPALGVAFGVGFLSSTLGIGGGVIHVPAMIHLLAFPAAVATATSQFILAFTAAVGGSTHLALGNVRWELALPLGVGVVAGAQIGSAIGRRLRAAVVVRLLALGLVVVAMRLLTGWP